LEDGDSIEITVNHCRSKAELTNISYMQYL